MNCEIVIYICQWSYFFFSPRSEVLMDQEQTVLYEPLGELREVREVAKNVMKPGDKNTFPIIFLTVRPTPHCAVKQAHKVQDQCKSKCYFSSLPVGPHPVLCSCAPLQPCHAAQCPCHHSLVQRIISCCIFFEKVLSCET